MASYGNLRQVILKLPTTYIITQHMGSKGKLGEAILNSPYLYYYAQHG